MTSSKMMTSSGREWVGALSINRKVTSLGRKGVGAQGFIDVTILPPGLTSSKMMTNRLK